MTHSSPVRPAVRSAVRRAVRAATAPRASAGGVVETLRYGVSSPVTKASQSAVNATFISYLPCHQNGTLTQWSAYFGTGGAYKFIVMRPNGYTWDLVYISPSNITATVGVNTLTSSDFGVINMLPGDVVGFNGSVGRVTYLDADGFGQHNLSMGTVPTSSGNVLSFSAAVRNWQMNYSVTGVCNPSATLIDESFGHTGIPWDWEHQVGAWTYGSGVATSGTSGIANSLNYRFNIGNLSTWTWIADFTFDTSDARFAMATRNASQTTSGFFIEVNRSTGNLVVYQTSGQNGWTNSGGSSAVVTQATGITFSTATTYRMTIAKTFRSASVTITDVATPANTYTLSWSQEDATNGSNQIRGFGYGKPSLAAVTGTISVLSTNFSVPTAQPDYLFIGDSITEGSGLTGTTQSMARLVAAARGATVQTSAQGGAGTLHTPSRLAAELPHIRPRNIHFLIGTNDTVVADWKSKVGGMRDLASGLSTVYVGAVPAEAADTNPEVEFNPYIIAQGWATVRHDLALTSPATGLGADRNAALYADTLHPNASGHAAMAARFAADAP